MIVRIIFRHDGESVVQSTVQDIIHDEVADEREPGQGTPEHAGDRRERGAVIFSLKEVPLIARNVFRLLFAPPAR